MPLITGGFYSSRVDIKKQTALLFFAFCWCQVLDVPRGVYYSYNKEHYESSLVIEPAPIVWYDALSWKAFSFMNTCSMHGKKHVSCLSKIMSSNLPKSLSQRESKASIDNGVTTPETHIKFLHKS